MTTALIIISLFAAASTIACILIQSRLTSARSTIARLEERLRAAQESATERRERDAREEDRFRLLAGDILSKQVDRFNEHGERRLRELLDPLRQNIDSFRQSVADCYSKESRERFSLQERLHELIEMNTVIGRETRSLTSALKGNNRQQGLWGEFVLENILEMSGLRKGEEFVTQTTLGSDREDGRQLRPDVIVRYPDKHSVVIDAKTSMTAYMEYIEATTDQQRTEAGLRHVESVRRHIDELASKSYQDILALNSADFVMMFIPNEAAYITALQLDSTLWQRAYDKKVIIVSPTHLVSAMKLIRHLWSHDRQTRNALEIATAAGRMYDKFCGFITDMERIGKSISSISTAYDAAMNKLSTGQGCLTNRAEQLREMGARATKQIDRQA